VHSGVARRGALSVRLASFIFITCGVSTMKHASFPATIDSAVPVTSPPVSSSPVAAPPVASPEASTRPGLFQRLLATLHHSRRLQAQRVLAQYRHLIVRPETTDTKSNAAESGQVGD
jgi:hypothetical protein